MCNGILIDGYEAGARTWNPLTSGRTKIEFQPFYRQQQLDDEFDNEYDLETLGLTLSVVYDNTDWSRNPSRGSRTRIAVSRDWGTLDDDAPEWTAVEFEYSKYLDLGSSKISRKRILAANVWTSYVPTWNDSHFDDRVLKSCTDRRYLRDQPWAAWIDNGDFRVIFFTTVRLSTTRSSTV